MKKRITVAHSPDADDIFMFYAIKFGWISSPEFEFESIALDIETLNVEALKGTYDITAISFGLYPRIRDEYALLNSATSFGDGYGPKLIRRKDKVLKRNFRVALSGENTTNALLFKLAYPEARIKYYNFLEIENAVISGEVDAGVLIHESILNFSNELEVEAEIWDIWQNFAGKETPLPLGGMAIRRSFPLTTAIKLQQIIQDGVRVAVKNSPILSKMLLERDLVRIEKDELEKYLNLYANNQSINISDTEEKALDKLFEIGFQKSIFDTKVETKNYTIPSDYADFRFS
ncbi:putative periplasmic solute-binding protein [Thiovulum sp. ES]|nr:putative periplasmic solute-binding protein [Thiovulum sp. ES]